MRFEKREARWRQWLTQSEAETIAEIDALEKQSRARNAERSRIANRAAQRARYHHESDRPVVARGDGAIVTSTK